MSSVAALTKDDYSRDEGGKFTFGPGGRDRFQPDSAVRTDGHPPAWAEKSQRAITAQVDGDISLLDAVEAYTGSEAEEINTALRRYPDLPEIIAERGGDTDDLPADVLDATERGSMVHVAALVDLANQPLPVDAAAATLYRGVTGGIADQLADLEPGAVFEAHGLQSTTLDPSTADAFTGHDQSRIASLILEIKGAKQGFVVPDEQMEREIVLPHRTRYQALGPVKSLTFKTRKGTTRERRVLQVEVIYGE